MTRLSATAWMKSTMSSRRDVRSWMSSRSNGATNAASSRAPISRSMWSPCFSSAWISAIRSSSRSKSVIRSRSFTAAADRFWPLAANRSRNFTSRGISRKVMRRLLSAQSEHVEYEPGGCGYEAGRGDGDYPGDKNAASDTPAHRAQSARGTDAKDAGADHVRRRYRHAKVGGRQDDRRGGRFSGETVDRLELDNTVAHRVHDPPAAYRRAKRQRCCRHDDHPIGHVDRSQNACAEESQSDDAHGLLGIVRAMREGHEPCGHDL